MGIKDFFRDISDAYEKSIEDAKKEEQAKMLIQEKDDEIKLEIIKLNRRLSDYEPFQLTEEQLELVSRSQKKNMKYWINYI